MDKIEEIEFFSFLGGDIKTLRKKYQTDPEFRAVVDAYHRLVKHFKKPYGICNHPFYDTEYEFITSTNCHNFCSSCGRRVKY